MATANFTIPIKIDAKAIIDWLNENDIVAVVRCAHCAYWDSDTFRYQHNDFRTWNECECKMLAERDGYNEINRYTEADDYCSYGEKREGAKMDEVEK